MNRSEIIRTASHTAIEVIEEAIEDGVFGADEATRAEAIAHALRRLIDHLGRMREEVPDAE